MAANPLNWVTCAAAQGDVARIQRLPQAGAATAVAVVRQCATVICIYRLNAADIGLPFISLLRVKIAFGI